MADQNFYYGTNAPNQTYYGGTSGSQPTNLNYNSPTQQPQQQGYLAPPAVTPAMNMGQNQSPNSINFGSTTSSSSHSFIPQYFAGPQAQRPNYAPPPPAPNYGQLNQAYLATQRQGAINAAMKDYDALSASTQAQGFQSANNAGNIYANRLQQQGINPVASGVVAAQAKLPVYGQLAGITAQKEQTRLDATNKAQTLAAQISGQIAGLKQSYAGMLADYNSRIGGYDLDLNKFNASNYQYDALNQDTYFKQQQLNAQRAAMAAGGAGSGGGTNGRPANFSPGYIPNSGPIIPSMTNGVINQGQVAVGY